MYFVYILFSESLRKFYIGQTNDFTTRLLNHNSKENQNWTKGGRPWQLFLKIPCSTRLSAVRLEKFIKKQKSNVFIHSLKNDPDLLERICSKHDC